MTMKKGKTQIAIAAIQMESFHGQVEENCRRATELIEQATSLGAEIVLLPELFSTGYIPNSSIWQYGETIHGPTIMWSKKTSERLGIYMGVGFLEIQGNDFINSYAITNPRGELEGKAQKENGEACCFKRGEGVHIIENPFWTAGIAICADGHYTKILKRIRENDIDFMVLPHAWPSPYKTSRFIKPDVLKKKEIQVKNFAATIAGFFGVPTVFVNQIGEMGRMDGFFGRLMTPETFRMQGYSRIIDSDGKLKASLESEEGVIFARVLLDPSLKKNVPIPDFDGVVEPGSRLGRRLIIPLAILIASLRYKLSRKRKQIIQKHFCGFAD